MLTSILIHQKQKQNKWTTKNTVLLFKCQPVWLHGRAYILIKSSNICWVLTDMQSAGVEHCSWDSNPYPEKGYKLVVDNTPVTERDKGCGRKMLFAWVRIPTQL